MIENFSEEGIQLMITELKEQGYLDRRMGKITAMHKAEEKLSMEHPDTPDGFIRNAIYVIADVLTENKGRNVVRGKTVEDMRNQQIAKGLENEYCDVVYAIMKAIEPYLKKGKGTIRSHFGEGRLSTEQLKDLGIELNDGQED